MTFKSVTLGGLLSAALFATAVPAQALTIDSFDCIPHTVTQDFPGPITDLSPVCSVGGFREQELEAITGTDATHGVTGGVGQYFLYLNNDDGVNSRLSVRWGDFAGGVLDVTEGGLNNGFVALVNYVNQLATIHIGVSSDNGANVAWSQVSNVAAGAVNLPFTSFVGGPVNLTALTGIALLIDGDPGLDIEIDDLSALPVPEPATFMLLGLGLLGLGAKRVLRKA